jgi:hypothetical protein
VIDGFSLAPSIGGIGSLDLFGSLHLLTPREGDGFTEKLKGWGIGTRVGILRESFSLPGVSVSLTYRVLDEAQWGAWEEGDNAEARFDVTVASFRVVAGKDILGMGLLAGMGWDGTSAGGDARVRLPGSGTEGSVSAKWLKDDRKVYFFGGSMTFVILQVSAEVGWSEGFSQAYPTGEEGRFDPSSRSLFASLALRLSL